MRHILAGTTATVSVVAILACSGTDVGRTLNEVVPAVREVNPEFNTEKVDCSEPFETPPPNGCAMAQLSCGDEIRGNNRYGEHNYGDEFYVKKFCGTQRHSYQDSPEAIFLLSVPANVEANVILASDCADLDISSISVPPDTTARCPTLSHAVQVCEMDQKRGGGSIRINTVDRAETHFVVVDGKDGATGNFRLRVECRQYR